MGIKITQYPNTQTSFDDDDEFDVSAYVAPATPYESRKYTWVGFKTAIVAYLGQLWPSGTAGQIMKRGASIWQATSEIFINSGNVGINNTSPSFRLDVKHTAADVETVSNVNNSSTNTSTAVGTLSRVDQLVLASIKDNGNVSKEFGNPGDVSVAQNIGADADVNIISYGSSTNKGGVNLFCDITDPLLSAPTFRFVKGGGFLTGAMQANGFTNDSDAFVITDKVSASKAPTGDFLEFKIGGVTAYLPIYS